MNQIVAGLLLGLVLGAIDGATAWFYPEARSMMGSIMMGSSVKGMVVGLLCGWFARQVHSTGWLIAGGIRPLYQRRHAGAAAGYGRGTCMLCSATIPNMAAAARFVVANSGVLLGALLTM